MKKGRQRKRERNKIATMLQMIYLVKPLIGYMLFAVLLGSLGFLVAAAIPVMGSFILLCCMGSYPTVNISLLWGVLISFAFLRSLFRYGEQKINHYIAFTLLAIIRNKLFAKLRILSPAKLEGKDKGNLISLITTDVELLEVFYAHTISPICIAILVSSVTALFIGFFHWELGLLSFCAFAIVGVLLPVIVAKLSGNLGSYLRGKTGKVSSLMLENILGIQTIIQFNAGKKRLDEMNRQADSLVKDQSRLNWLNGTNFAITNSLILFFNLLMILLSLFIYQKGVIGFEAVVICIVTLFSSFGSVVALANLGTTLLPTIAAADRVLSILEEEPQTPDVIDKIDVKFDELSCNNLSFSYDNNTALLKGLSLSISKNEIVGIVGKSGCGKSTLLKLLMRFWEPTKGTIEISKISLSQINTTCLRNMMGYMTQQSFLFKDTIANNIAIASPTASKKKIIEACKKAALHDFITKLPKGYDTMIDELGESLSSGEQQRIGLARLFLQDNQLLLLDEPTSNVDSLNEAVILKSIKEYRGNKAVVLVSHRASTVKIADRQLQMENGAFK